jgi:hypothetical protein
MSVLSVFGSNLSSLVRLHGSQTQVAEDSGDHSFRIRRCLWIKLEPGCREALRIARHPGIMPWDEVPRYILPRIQPGNESF